MAQSPHTIAAIRYGFGFRPGQMPPGSADALLASLKAKPMTGDAIGTRVKLARAYRKASKVERETGDGAERMRLRRQIRLMVAGDFRAELSRAFEAQNGFEERLLRFWADHFTVAGKNLALVLFGGDLPQTALRPHLTGRFADMLFAAITHPGMLIYLDQVSSVGPNSRVGQRRNRGLNENLAREVLELHTMGVNAGYLQRDVTELAELLTGLSVDEGGMLFRTRIAEPGSEEVLGKRYGSDPSLANIRDVLEDIARHPDTARHLATKLVRHFVSDKPDARLVEHVANAYRQNDGSLMAAYTALLEHPAGWGDLGGKVKQPFDYIVSSLRALALSPTDLTDGDMRKQRGRLFQPMQTMGQPRLRPAGPDGWPEDAAHWITPAGMAARIAWVHGLASKFGVDLDPRRFLDASLGDAASPALRAAVAGSEVKWEGVALALASPEFNRR